MTHNDLHYEFGPYQLNPGKRILTRNGEGIPLTPKATEILLLLVKHAGQLIEKDELLKEVWPDTFVEEANLSQNIFILRRALGDDRIARRGYRFMSSVKTIGTIGCVSRLSGEPLSLVSLYARRNRESDQPFPSRKSNSIQTMNVNCGRAADLKTGHALLIMFEEVGDGLVQNEKNQISDKLKRLFESKSH